MKSNLKNILGITVCQTGLHILQLKKQAKQHLIQKSVHIPFDNKISLDTPQLLTKAITETLLKNKFTAKNAILGIPTKWTITKEKKLPASSKSDALSILHLQANTDFSINSQSLLIDYAGKINDKKESNLLLVAGQKNKIQNITQILADAHIKIAAILPTTLALASESSDTIINITNSDVELATPTKYQYHNIQHIPAKPLPQNPNGQLLTWSKTITDQINRSNALNNNRKSSIQVSTTNPLSQSALQQLSTNTQKQIDSPSIKTSYLIAPEVDLDNNPPTHATAQLAALAFTPKKLPVNLIDSKIVIQKVSASNQKKNIITAAVVLCVITLALIINNFVQASIVQNIQDEIDQNVIAANNSKKLNAKTKIADQWIGKRPSPINAIHDLSQILSNNQDIYIRTIDIKLNDITIKGSALNDSAINSLSNEIIKAKQFTKHKTRRQNLPTKIKHPQLRHPV